MTRRRPDSTVRHIFAEVIPSENRLLRRAVVSAYFFFQDARLWLEDVLLDHVGTEYDLRDEVLWNMLSPDVMVRRSVQRAAHEGLLVLFGKEIRAREVLALEQARFLETLLYAMSKFNAYPSEFSGFLTLTEQVVRHSSIHGAFLLYLGEGLLAHSPIATQLADHAKAMLDARPGEPGYTFWQELLRVLLALHEQRMDSNDGGPSVREAHHLERIRQLETDMTGRAPQDVYDAVCKLLGTLLNPLDYAYCLLAEADRGFEVKAVWHSKGLAPQPGVASHDVGMLAITTFKIHHLAGAALEDARKQHGFRYSEAEEVLLVPWFCQGHLIGSICLGRKGASFAAGDTQCVLDAGRHLGPVVLDAMRKEDILRQGVSSKGLREFAAHIAHELRNPLAAMKDNLWVAEHNISRPEKALTHMRKAVNILTDIEEVIAGITALSGYRNLAKEKLDLNALVADSAEAVRAAKGTDVTITVQPLERALPFMANGPAVKSALQHIITNAVEASIIGGAVFVRTTLQAGDAVCEIRDQGVGVPADQVEHVFDPFWSTKKESTVRGMGLTTAREVIEDHKGEIEFRSEPGKGTIVICRFPLA